MKNIHPFLPVIVLSGLAMVIAHAQDLKLDIPKAESQHNVKAEKVTYRGKPALRVTEAGAKQGDFDDRVLILPETNFQDGEITLELAGDVEPNAGAGARGFVGLAFRITPNADKFECFYLRPTNGRAEDQVRRNHSAQYIAHPEFPWHRLRKEFPEKYESYVDLEPGVWTKVRITVKGTQARLFVHGLSQPTLIVNDLKLGTSSGAVGLWIGPGTVAHFTDLRVTK